MITSSATTVIGFSLQGNTVPAGEGVLVILDVEGDADAACLSGLVLSDSGGNALDATVEDCTTIVVGSEPALPSVTINSPEDSANIYGMDIDVSVSGSNLMDGDHYHAYLDGTLAGMFYEDNFTISNVAYGDHILNVVVADGVHQDYEHPEASDCLLYTSPSPRD